MLKKKIGYLLLLDLVRFLAAGTKMKLDRGRHQLMEVTAILILGGFMKEF